MRRYHYITCSSGAQISIHAPLAGCDVREQMFQQTGWISIHAPLAGCDLRTVYLADVSQIFQSTHPLRGATDPARQRADAQQISIHAPLAGCDLSNGGGGNPSPAISIHAPLAGCDAQGRAGERPAAHFNPRTPCGVRPRRLRSGRAGQRFQSTHPLRGATILDVVEG